jgi:hypothetical protein
MTSSKESLDTCISRVSLAVVRSGAVIPSSCSVLLAALPKVILCFLVQAVVCLVEVDVLMKLYSPP